MSSKFPKQPSMSPLGGTGSVYSRVVVPVLCMMPVLVVPFWSLVLGHCHDPEPAAPVEPQPEAPAEVEDYTRHCQSAPPDDFNGLIEVAAEAHGINPRMIALTVYRESHCKAEAVGAVGEIGLGQVYPAIWSHVLTEEGIIKSVGDLYDPAINLLATGFILSESLRYAKGNPADALRRYNGSGPAARRYAREQSRRYRLLWEEPIWFRDG